MRSQWGKTILGVVAALGLAASLAGCHGGKYDEGADSAQEPETPAVSGEFAEELSALQQLMESQDTSYTYDFDGIFTVGEGDFAEETVIDYVMQTEGGSLTKTLETYSEEDGVFPNCQIYTQGGQVIEVNEDTGAIDMTQVIEPSEPIVSEEDVYRALLAHATDVQVNEEGEGTLFTVAAQGVDMGLVNQVDNATDLTATYRFDGEGVLLETTASIEGTTGEGADMLPASESFTVVYSDWGATTVPFAPPATGIYEVGDGLSFDEDLVEVLAKMPKNFTCIAEVTTTLFQGDLSLSQDMHLETYQDTNDGLRALVYLEAPDSGIDEMYTYIDGDRVTASVDGEVVSADYNYESEDPTGLGQAAQLVACAAVVDRISYGNGEIEYVLYTDPQTVSDTVDMDGWGELALCEAHYYVSADGELIYMTLNVEGVPENADMADYMAAETVAQYSDFNNTEVFNPFA